MNKIVLKRTRINVEDKTLLVVLANIVARRGIAIMRSFTIL
jgi:hypothetical protein